MIAMANEMINKQGMNKWLKSDPTSAILVESRGVCKNKLVLI